jgi:hypothetical protein
VRTERGSELAVAYSRPQFIPWPTSGDAAARPQAPAIGGGPQRLEVAEQCLAHKVGDKATQADLRTTMLNRCRKVDGGLGRILVRRERRGQGSALRGQGPIEIGGARRFDLKTVTWGAFRPAGGEARRPASSARASPRFPRASIVTGSRDRLSNRVLARDEERPASSTRRGAPRCKVGAAALVLANPLKLRRTPGRRNPP